MRENVPTEMDRRLMISEVASTVRSGGRYQAFFFLREIARRDRRLLMAWRSVAWRIDFVAFPGVVWREFFMGIVLMKNVRNRDMGM